MYVCMAVMISLYNKHQLLKKEKEPIFILAKFFWVKGMRFLFWDCQDFFWDDTNISKDSQRRPKTFKDVRSLPKMKLSRNALASWGEYVSWFVNNISAIYH